MHVAEELAGIIGPAGFLSLPGGDNHQKILGQGSGITLTPTCKGERKKTNLKIGLILPRFSFLQ